MTSMVISGSLSGVELVIDELDRFNVIRADAVLEACTLRIKVPSRSLGIGGQLIGTTIVAEKELVKSSWVDATMIRCRFVGKYRENEFGTLSGSSSGASRECDFSSAVLHDCMVFGELAASNVFPGWPHFVILDPHRNQQKMKELASNPEISVLVRSIDYFDKRLGAIVLNATSVARRLSLDAEELRTFFTQFDFVRTV